MTVQEAFQSALGQHRAGRLAEAETLYRQILAVQPNHAEALQYLGVIAHQMGRNDLAVQMICQAIVLDPQNSGAYSNLGAVQCALKRLEEGIASYRRAVELKPDYVEAHNNLGNAHREQGRLDEAIASYLRVLELKPDFAEAHYNLGIALNERGQFEEAIAAYRRAVELKPDFMEAHNNLGSALKERGQLEQSIAAYRRAVQLNPNLAATHFELGNLCRNQGLLDEAIAAYRQALGLQPGFAEAHNNLGNALKDRRQFVEAIAAYRQALALQSDFAEAHYNLGVLLKEQGQLDEAIAAYRRALALKPDLAEAHNNLGVVYKARGRLDEAIVAYRQALALQPNLAEAHNNLGIAFTDQGQLDDAIAAFHQALGIRPDFAEAYNNLGIALNDQGRLEEALVACCRAVEIRPDFAAAHNNLGTALKDQGRFDEAIAAFRRALEIQPTFAEAVNNLGAALKSRGELASALAALRESLSLEPEQPLTHSNLIFALHSDPSSDARVIAEEQRRWCQRFGEPFKRFIRPHANERNPDRRLRIGYVSPDFRDHVAGRNVLPLFKNHDHRNFEVVCYSGVARPDEMTAELRQLVELWRSTLGLEDDAVAEMIRQDGVDILVDLVLHSAHNRLPVFAQQPAPVQVSFAGYPESTGLDTIEHRISDRWLEFGMPHSEFPSEHVFLIDSFWCYDPCGMSVEVNGLPAPENGCVTFGSLSNFHKINEPVLRLWSSALRRVKNARLLILCAAGSHRQRTLEVFQREGVESERIEFLPHCSRRNYLELYHRVDIALDPFPYNGHTTSLDALWMGVPVVSLAGETRVSRGGLSILTNIGLPELAAHSENEYVAIASQLAHDLPRLAELRRTLRSRMEVSILMDAPRFARGIEAAYRGMWRQWCVKNGGAVD